MALYETEDGRPITTRFWSKVKKTPYCWLWQRAVHNEYGQFSIGNRMVGAHRVAWELTYGELQPGEEVDHRCHNKLCVRPSHLRKFTHAQNGAYRRGAQSNSKSGIRGVFWNKQRGRWGVKVSKAGKQYHGGFFDDVDEARQAAIALRKRVFEMEDFNGIV